MSDKKLTAWQKKCEAAAAAAGVTVSWLTSEPCDTTDQFEDDGYLHIEKKGQLHAYFDIGQDTPGTEANRMTRTIMESLGLGGKISVRVLVDEPVDEEDDRCQHCGR